MTVPTETSRVAYVGNDITTNFSTGFYFLDEDDLVVKHTPFGPDLVEVVLTLGVHYTVNMPASVGAAGSIDMVTPPATDDALVIERTLDIVQDTSFRSAGAFDRVVHETRFDKDVMIAQQLARRVSDLESAGAAGSVVAGNGVSFSGTTLHVGAGDGIDVDADTVAVDAADLVGDGLEEDGSNNLAVLADDGIVVGATGVSVDFATTTEDINGSAGAVGTDVKAARQDHTHKVLTDAPVDIGSANAAGSGPKLAFNDHVHDHGQQTDGTFHAVAVAASGGAGGTNGFISAADQEGLGDLLDDTLWAMVHATRSTAQTLNVGTTTLAINSEDVDLTDSYDAATGLFTAPAAGYYLVAVLIYTAATLWTVADKVYLYLDKNSGTAVATGTIQAAWAAQTVAMSSQVAVLIHLAEGDTLEAKAVVAGATNTTLGHGELSIARVR